MELSKPELHGSGFHALLSEADHSFGVAEVNGMLADLGVTRAALSDSDAWFSLEFAEALMGSLALRDKELITRAMRRMFSPQGLGLLYPLFRAFGTPMFSYRQVAKLSSRLNKVGGYTVKEKGPGHIELIYRVTPGAPMERG